MARYIDVEPFMDWLVKRAKECKQSKFDYTRIKGGAFNVQCVFIAVGLSATIAND